MEWRIDLSFFTLSLLWSSLPPTCPPRLTHSQCQQYRESTSVLENQPAGTFVLQVHAVDADEGSNGRVTYGFMHKDSTVPAFSIHPETGTETHKHSCAHTYTCRTTHMLLSHVDNILQHVPFSLSVCGRYCAGNKWEKCWTRATLGFWLLSLFQACFSLIHYIYKNSICRLDWIVMQLYL